MPLAFKPTSITITPDMMNGFLFGMLFILIALGGFYLIMKYYFGEL